MQEMDVPQDVASGPGSYGAYTGEQPYRDNEGPLRGQKLDLEYETVQDVLIRRMKQELQAESKKTGERSASQRLMLALVSVCALVVLFGFVVLALTFGHLSDTLTVLLGGSMFFVIGAIVTINAYFTFAARAQKAAKKQGQEEKENPFSTSQ